MPPTGNPAETHPPLIVLFGPTAVGKTALSLALAEAIHGEILSIDSRLVYQGMDIGVAPDEVLSLAVFQRLAYAAIADVTARGRVPLLVGGTGQYISAVIEGWNIPEVRPNPALRAELEAYAAEHGPDALHARLASCDPDAATAIHPNNVRRVVRALEVFLETGQPISRLQRKTPPPYQVLQVGLTRPRDVLHRRIDARLDEMLANGLLEEVRGLLAAGVGRTLPAMSGLGYAQLAAYLAGEMTLAEAIEAIRRDTRDFARRQDVWFKKHNRAAHWFDLESTAPADVVTFVQGWLESVKHATT